MDALNEVFSHEAKEELHYEWGGSLLGKKKKTFLIRLPIFLFVLRCVRVSQERKALRTKPESFPFARRNPRNLPIVQIGTDKRLKLKTELHI